MDELRCSAPVALLGEFPYNVYTFTRRDTILDALQRPSCSRIAARRSRTRAGPGPRLGPVGDRPDSGDARPSGAHALEKGASPFFSPRAVQAREPRIRRLCCEILDSFIDDGKCDFLAQFAMIFPTTIFMEILGIPVERHSDFMSWIHRALHGDADTDPDMPVQKKAYETIRGYFAELIESREADPDPHDDLVGNALTWQIDEKQPTDDELLSVFNLLCDVDFHSCPLKAGELIFLPTAAAGRDDTCTRTRVRTPRPRLAAPEAPP